MYDLFFYYSTLEETCDEIPRISRHLEALGVDVDQVEFSVHTCGAQQWSCVATVEEIPEFQQLITVLEESFPDTYDGWGRDASDDEEEH